MSEAQRNRAMIALVAFKLGDELLREMAFVGGCTTALLLTDQYSMEQVRHTEDVDLIVHAIGMPGWHQLQKKLRERGFREDVSSPDAPICAMQLNGLRVDFMPDDETVLGWGNRWYRNALLTAENYPITDDLIIRLVLPSYFVATKLEAYRGRGHGDPLMSQDIEDILILLDGRPEIVANLNAAPTEVLRYVQAQFTSLLQSNAFEHAVTAASNQDAGREQLIFERI